MKKHKNRRQTGGEKGKKTMNRNLFVKRVLMSNFSAVIKIDLLSQARGGTRPLKGVRPLGDASAIIYIYIHTLKTRHVI